MMFTHGPKFIQARRNVATERDVHGASSILSFSEYRDVRSDKDIRKSYLQGRLGGIPRFLVNDLSCIYDNKEKRGDN